VPRSLENSIGRVYGERLDDHPCAVLAEKLMNALGGFPGAFDGFVLIVKTATFGRGEGNGEEDDGGAFSTANSGDASAGCALGLYVIVGSITVAKEFSQLGRRRRHARASYLCRRRCEMIPQCAER
jgi:hypothetical protein